MDYSDFLMVSGNTEGLNNAQDPLGEVDETPLAEEVLNLLGTDDSSNILKGDIIHKHVALRWESILSKELKEEIRLTLVQKYPPIKNCPLVAAPKLNLEVKVAVNEGAVNRDARLASLQTQMGASLAALGKALTVLLEKEEAEGGPSNNLQLIEAVSDSARLLADIHFQESEARRNLLGLKLNKDLKETMTNSGIDGWLFGDNLGERVKLAKAMEKSGQELKTATTKTPRPRPFFGNSLNGKGPSRNSRLGGRKYQSGTRSNNVRKSHSSRQTQRGSYHLFHDKGRRSAK